MHGRRQAGVRVRRLWWPGHICQLFGHLSAQHRLSVGRRVRSEPRAVHTQGKLAVNRVPRDRLPPTFVVVNLQIEKPDHRFCRKRYSYVIVANLIFFTSLLLVRKSIELMVYNFFLVVFKAEMLTNSITVLLVVLYK